MNSLGIDIGTTGICGIIVDCESGEILDSVNMNNDSFIKTDKEYERIQSPERITEIVEIIVKKLCNAETKAIGISNQMHGILYADESGRAISPLYTWPESDSDGDSGIFADCFNLASVSARLQATVWSPTSITVRTDLCPKRQNT